MAKHKVKDPKAIISIILAAIGLPLVVVLLTLGGIFFFKEYPKISHYANSMCEVDRRTYKIYQCRSRFYNYYCYGPIWNVHYEANRNLSGVVEIEKRYRSSSDALQKAYAYEIGSSYSCWYDTRNPTIAQWNKPDIRLGVILLSCGGATILLAGILIFVAIHLVKEEIAQSQHDNINPYSSPNSYTKN